MLPGLGSFAAQLAEKDPVTAVNQFCQRKVGRCISKNDIEYTTAMLVTGGCQVTVKLNCLGGQEFAGEVCANAKDAKLSASQQVLEYFAPEISELPAAGGSKKSQSKQKNKRERPLVMAGILQPGMLPPGSFNPEMLEVAPPPAKVPKVGVAVAATGESIDRGPVIGTSHKGDLNTVYCKIVRRVIQKGEIVYTSGQVVGGFQAQVQLPGLPAPWNNEVWAGEVCHKKSDAEQSVAAVALQSIRNDPQLMAAFNAPPKPNTFMMNKGNKGKGKGKGHHHHHSSSSHQSAFAHPQAHEHAAWNQQYAAAMAAAGYPQYLGAGLGALDGVLS